VYGPPRRLGEVEALVRAAGCRTRRTGTAVAVLRAEGLPPATRAELTEGVPRPANLEDVFVLLTGEDVE
jgi:lipooligosaccharide transport system ATP-binding protein